jgi:hypothetical protein
MRMQSSNVSEASAVRESRLCTNREDLPLIELLAFGASFAITETSRS